MEFNFASEQDRINHSVLKRVIEKGGVWLKAGHFFNMFKKIERSITPDDAFRLFAIDMGIGQKLIQVNAIMRHTNYGSRSMIPWMCCYVVDEYGVVSQYKIRGNGNLRDGWVPDRNKTVLAWEREPNYQIPEWLADLQEEPVEPIMLEIPHGSHTVQGRVISIKETCTPYGNVNKFLIETGGEGERCRLYGTVPKAISDVQVGQTVEFTARLDQKEPGFGFFSRPKKARIIEEKEND